MSKTEFCEKAIDITKNVSRKFGLGLGFIYNNIKEGFKEANKNDRNNKKNKM